MTPFETFEESVEQSRPIELHQFAIEATQFNFHNQDDGTITVGLDVYTPEAITRSEIARSTEDRNTELTISVPRENAVAQLFIGVVPGQRMSYTLRRFQRPEGTGDIILLFKGLVRSVNFVKNTRQANIIVKSLESAASRTIPLFTYMGLCNHVLYDARCKVDEGLFDFVGIVSAISLNVLTLPGADGETDGFYDGGFVFFPSINDYRLILTHVGNDLTLLLPFPEDAVGSSVTIFAGCDHTIATCKTKFDNVINYGGFAFVPILNPFEVGLV